MNINLHIERLVLDDVGIQPHQKNELKEAVASSLRQQFVNQSIGSKSQLEINQSSVSGGSISVANSPSIESLGRQVGNAVYRGVEK